MPPVAGAPTLWLSVSFGPRSEAGLGCQAKEPATPVSRKFSSSCVSRVRAFNWAFMPHLGSLHASPVRAAWEDPSAGGIRELHVHVLLELVVIVFEHQHLHGSHRLAGRERHRSALRRVVVACDGAVVRGHVVRRDRSRYRFRDLLVYVVRQAVDESHLEVECGSWRLDRCCVRDPDVGRAADGSLRAIRQRPSVGGANGSLVGAVRYRSCEDDYGICSFRLDVDLPCVGSSLVDRSHARDAPLLYFDYFPDLASLPRLRVFVPDLLHVQREDLVAESEGDIE